MKLSQISRQSNGRPRIRASWCERLQTALHGLPEADQARVEDCVGPRMRAAIVEAGQLGWVPVEAFVEFIDGILDVVGDDRFFALYYAALLADGQGPMLRITSTSAIQLFGPRGVVLGFVPSWEMVARDCAKIRAGHSDDPAETEVLFVEFAELPVQLGWSWGWVAICRATLQASIDAAGLEGVVEQCASASAAALRFRLMVRAKRVSLLGS